ncbi:MAG: hypothetical protein H0U96_06440 [Acidobacteria bacterium]|jgi:hypothetical protein|nr:hypothetical protein [Acidobacteriota bacterium]
MKLFEGKSPAEKNKIIALIVLGAMVVLVIGYNVTALYPSRKTNVTVTATASPTPTASTRNNSDAAALLNNEEINFLYTTTPINYSPGAFYAPDAGRNIFAFYEPPPPPPYVAPPIVIKAETPYPVPTPAPTPPILVGFVTPQSVYAGSKSFRMEVNGDKFTPDSIILFNGNPLPTTFVSPQQLVAEIPSNFIASPGAISIMVRTPDGKLYSNQVMLDVQAAPVPQFQYIGMIGRKRSNNDTAYFQEQGKNSPISARLNDIVNGRFRLVSISVNETVLEDVNLGFRHKLALYRPAPGQNASSDNPNNPNNLINKNRYNQFNQPLENPPVYIPPQEIPGIPGNIQPQQIPGIPNNIPRYNPQQPPQPTPNKNNNDEDDDDPRY